MATLEQLERALRNADAAGATEDAQRLAQEIQRMRQEQQPGVAEDIARSIPTGLRAGVELGLGTAGSSRELEQGILEAAGVPSGVRTAARFLNPVTAFAPSTQEIQNLTNRLIGQPRQPETVAGEFARTAGEFAPAALFPPARVGGAARTGIQAGRRILQALIPAFGSEAAGQAARRTVPQLEPAARVAGALGGAVAPGLARRAVTPLPTSPERQRLVQTLARERVPVTAGQATGRQQLQRVERQFGGGAAQRLLEQQGEAFTAAALNRAGIKARRATPEALNKGLTDIGNEFDRLSAGNSLVADSQFADDIVSNLDEYQSTVARANQAPIVEKLSLEAIEKAQRGMSGVEYKKLASNLRRRIRKSGQDPDRQEALIGLSSALDDAMERSIAVSNPADLGAWREARRLYRNFLVIERAATGPGAAAAEGIISPSQLRTAVVSKQGRRGFGLEQGDFAELARAGEGVLRAPSTSGTAENLFARALGGVSPSAAVGGVIGAGVGGAPGAVGGALAGAATQRALGGALLSQPVRRALSNQLLAAQPTTARDQLLRALLARQAIGGAETGGISP